MRLASASHQDDPTGDRVLNLLTKNPKDLLAGLLFLAFGVFFFVYGQDYQIGTARRMGPGYFPFYLSLMLILIGLGVVARGLFRHGTPIGRIAWFELGVITAGILMFAFLIRPAGIIPSIALFVVAASFAYPPVKPIPTAISAVAVSVGCWLVFSLGLGLPFSAFGTWFGG